MREELTEAVVWRCSEETMLSEIPQNQHENTHAGASLSTESQASGLQLLKMETPAQAPSGELCEISKNTSLPDKTPPVAASKLNQINNDLIKKIYET